MRMNQWAIINGRFKVAFIRYPVLSINYALRVAFSRIKIEKEKPDPEHPNLKSVYIV